MQSPHSTCGPQIKRLSEPRSPECLKEGSQFISWFISLSSKLPWWLLPCVFYFFSPGAEGSGHQLGL